MSDNATEEAETNRSSTPPEPPKDICVHDINWASSIKFSGDNTPEFIRKVGEEDIEVSVDRVADLHARAYELVVRLKDVLHSEIAAGFEHNGLTESDLSFDEAAGILRAAEEAGEVRLTDDHRFVYLPLIVGERAPSNERNIRTCHWCCDDAPHGMQVVNDETEYWMCYGCTRWAVTKFVDLETQIWRNRPGFKSRGRMPDWEPPTVREVGREFAISRET